jgi:hypothetical protein
VQKSVGYPGGFSNENQSEIFLGSKKEESWEFVFLF